MFFTAPMGCPAILGYFSGSGYNLIFGLLMDVSRYASVSFWLATNLLTSLIVFSSGFEIVFFLIVFYSVEESSAVTSSIGSVDSL